MGRWFECKADGMQYDDPDDAVINQKVWATADNTCHVFKRLIYCRKEADCLTDTLMETCKNDKDRFKQHYNANCNVDCTQPKDDLKGSSRRIIYSSFGVPVLMSLALAFF